MTQNIRLFPFAGRITDPPEPYEGRSLPSICSVVIENIDVAEVVERERRLHAGGPVVVPHKAAGKDPMPCPTCGSTDWQRGEG